MNNKECIYCKKSFTPSRSNQKYCSDSCRVLSCNQRKRKKSEKVNSPVGQRNKLEGELKALNGTIKSKEEEINLLEKKRKEKELQLANDEKKYKRFKYKVEKQISSLYERIKVLSDPNLRKRKSSAGRIARMTKNQSWVSTILLVGATIWLENELDKQAEIRDRPKIILQLTEAENKLTRLNKLLKKVEGQWNVRENSLTIAIQNILKKKESLEEVLAQNRKFFALKQEEYERSIVKLIKDKGTLTRGERDLKRKFCKKFEFKGKWKEFIGLPSNPFHIVVYGSAGAGKGYFCLDFANYLSRSKFGKVLYISPEEFEDDTLDDKLDHFKVTSDPNWFITSGASNNDEIEKVTEEEKPVFAFIDSLTVANISDKQMQRLRRTFPEISFITILQTEKSGNIRGTNEFKHNCQAVIRIESGMAYREKNRFQGYTKEDFQISFPNKASSKKND